MIEMITKIEAVIFDLDGVIVSTDNYHYLAWKRLADEEGIYFDHKINERLRGVSRMESLDIMLEMACQSYSNAQKIEMANRKNEYYCGLLSSLVSKDILPGVAEFLSVLKERGIKLAIGSSSRNSPTILKRIGMDNFFDATADGNEIKKSKPDPEVFLLAAEKLCVSPVNCLVVEDAEAGIEAALAAGMFAFGVGSAYHDKRAHLRALDLESANVMELLRQIVK